MSETQAASAKVLPWQEQEAAELRAELHLMKTAGIIEVAVRNPSVSEYMDHWEGRATAAEAAIAALREENEELKAALDAREIESGLTRDGNLWRFWSQKAKDVASKLAAAEARAQAAEQKLADAERAIQSSSDLINRLMHVHVAPDECTSYVEPSRKWFMDNGGSLAAIADQQTVNRAFIKEAGE